MKILELSAMDGVGDDILTEMQTALEENFPLQVWRGTGPGPSGDAWDEKRGQHSAPLVLQRVLDRADARAEKILAVTASDLFIPMLSFVYGQAQLGGRAGIVSVARLHQEFYGLAPNGELLLARARKEAVHETGHLFGLVHCEEIECAMSLSTNVRQIDLKNDFLCEACRTQVWEGYL